MSHYGHSEPFNSDFGILGAPLSKRAVEVIVVVLELLHCIPDVKFGYY